MPLSKSFIFCTRFLLRLGSQGFAGQVHCGATLEVTHAHKHTYGQFRVPSLPHMHVSGLWEEAEVPHRQGEHANTEISELQTS